MRAVMLCFLLCLGATIACADQVSDAIMAHANAGPHRGAAGLEEVRDLRTQIGAMVAIAVALISGFGALLYKQGVAELRGEIQTSQAELGGRIDVLSSRVGAQNGRITKAEESVVLLTERQLDALNRYMHALAEAAATNKELLERMPNEDRV